MIRPVIVRDNAPMSTEVVPGGPPVLLIMLRTVIIVTSSVQCAHKHRIPTLSVILVNVSSTGPPAFSQSLMIRGLCSITDDPNRDYSRQRAGEHRVGSGRSTKFC